MKPVESDFRALFEGNPQPLVVAESDNLKVVEANAAALAMFGAQRSELVGRTLPDVFGSEAAGLRRWLEESAHSAPRDVGIGTGTLALAAAHAPVLWRGRNAHLIQFLDATERRHLEEQLRQAQKMEAVGLLAGGVAHDFNNLLTIITGYSQLLLGSMHPGDTNRVAVEQIMKAGERAAALTRQLLIFSRRQAVEPRVFNPQTLIASLAAMLLRLIGEDIDLRLDLDKSTGQVNADPGQLEQVVMNLVVNARDAMPRGGVLTIESRNVELDGDYAGRHMTAAPGRYVMLAVSDNGVGMDAQTRARVFEPFFTTKGQGRGTGLGLSTVFGIVKQSGGNIEVYSEPGRGSTFKVYLPRVDREAEPEADAPRRPAPGSETILLVEDDDMVRRLVRDTLEREGYRLLDAADAAGAQRMGEQHLGPIHLLITDVVMPRMNGRELAEALAPSRRDMRVLYMSGYTDTAVVNNGVLSADMAFIQKPFTPVALARKVREVLDKERAGHA